MLILDTDHLAAIDRGGEAGSLLLRRLDDSGQDIATTIISVEEQLRGWLAQIRRFNDPHRAVEAYERLQGRLSFFAAWTVLPWEKRSADLFVTLRRNGARCGSMDLKIACITVMHDATLLTRNKVDFARIPGLSIDDWLEQMK